MTSMFDTALQSLREGKDIAPVIAMSVANLAKYRQTKTLTPDMFVCLKLHGIHTVEKKRIGVWKDVQGKTYAQNDENENRYILTSIIPKDERAPDHTAVHTYVECVNHACNYGLELSQLASILVEKFPSVIWVCDKPADSDLFDISGTHRDLQGPMYMGQECLACMLEHGADSQDIGI